ncbi:hypothetical protein CHS0354_019703 [Potamilus streckersoni]|uniref:Uncharacterized protein n=1 Tax=Potamilus streckersoni TaxID=2493646 RepID=A0AAE0VSX2_9BIVA|nr:hypothetical protein CHS0354_019703 [Potamilus streckersoni]
MIRLGWFDRIWWTLWKAVLKYGYSVLISATFVLYAPEITMNKLVVLLSLLVVFVLEVHSQNAGGIPVSLPDQTPFNQNFGRVTSQQTSSRGMFNFNIDDLMRYYFLKEVLFN